MHAAQPSVWHFSALVGDGRNGERIEENEVKL